jgi:hypothetical protein
MTISNDSRDYRKFTEGATCNPEKDIPGLFPEVSTALGAMYKCRRGVIEGDKVQSVAGIPNIL